MSTVASSRAMAHPPTTSPCRFPPGTIAHLAFARAAVTRRMLGSSSAASLDDGNNVHEKMVSNRASHAGDADTSSSSSNVYVCHAAYACNKPDRPPNPSKRTVSGNATGTAPHRRKGTACGPQNAPPRYTPIIDAIVSTSNGAPLMGQGNTPRAALIRALSNLTTTGRRTSTTSPRFPLLATTRYPLM